ncbi:unnamed protein product [Rotaria magnacalcarata]|uniref:Uncharacterized protein n=1 Tax=Rotaria magnacalcarata TaxID=392030 RepID=A0A819V8A5_9BILA|nr:unnamed protein product [Rotaria magnacalcarata]
MHFLFLLKCKSNFFEGVSVDLFRKSVKSDTLPVTPTRPLKYSINERHTTISNNYASRLKLVENKTNQTTATTTKTGNKAPANHGLVDPHPMMEISMVPSTGAFKRTCAFIRNLPYMMYISIGIGGLHKMLPLFIIANMILNHQPMHN